MREPSREGHLARALSDLSRFPYELEDLERLRQSLELERAYGEEGVGAPAAGCCPRQRGDEHLARTSRAAEARRLDHGISEVIVTLARHLPAAHPHPQAHRRGRCPVVDIDGCCMETAHSRPADAR